VADYYVYILLPLTGHFLKHVMRRHPFIVFNILHNTVERGLYLLLYGFVINLFIILVLFYIKKSLFFLLLL
jgi:hypothetical protein